VAQKFYFAIWRIEVTLASRGLSSIAELLVMFTMCKNDSRNVYMIISYYAGTLRCGSTENAGPRKMEDQTLLRKIRLLENAGPNWKLPS